MKHKGIVDITASFVIELIHLLYWNNEQAPKRVYIGRLNLYICCIETQMAGKLLADKNIELIHLLYWNLSPNFCLTVSNLIELIHLLYWNQDKRLSYPWSLSIELIHLLYWNQEHNDEIIKLITDWTYTFVVLKPRSPIR